MSLLPKQRSRNQIWKGRFILRRKNWKNWVQKFYLFYLLQYRNVGIFYEHVVNRILNDLAETLAPKQMEVSGEFTARGGISTRVSAIYEEGK